MRTLGIALVAVWLSSCGGSPGSEPAEIEPEPVAAFSGTATADNGGGQEVQIETSYDPAFAEALQSQADIAADRAAEASQADAYATTKAAIDAFSIDVTRAYYVRVRNAGLELASALDVARGDPSRDAYIVRVITSADDGKFVLAETCNWSTCHPWATTSIVGYKGRHAGLAAYYDNTEQAPACREGNVTVACGCRFSFMEAYHTVPCARVIGADAPKLKAELLQWMVARTNAALREDAPQ